MTCRENCIHYDVCDYVSFTCTSMEKKCKDFKNKADFVEVVMCKDCGMSKETEDERYLFCMKFADTVDCRAFCSYGERKDA